MIALYVGAGVIALSTAILYGVVARVQQTGMFDDTRGWAGIVLTIAGCAMALTAAILVHQWGAAAVIGVALIAILLLLWDHWRRLRGKRTSRERGGKARARLSVMLARLRDHARPRRAPGPAPGGAR